MGKERNAQKTGSNPVPATKLLVGIVTPISSDQYVSQQKLDLYWLLVAKSLRMQLPFASEGKKYSIFICADGKRREQHLATPKEAKASL